MSESQEKLRVLLGKVTDVIPFATDEECEKAFVFMAKFAKDTIAIRDTPTPPSKYEAMDLNDLLLLAPTPERRKRKEKRSRSDDSHPQSGPPKNAHVVSDEQQGNEWDFNEVLRASFFFISFVSFFLLLKLSNVRQIMGVKDEPSLQIRLLAKRGGAGNFSVTSCFASLETLEKLANMEEVNHV